MDLQPYTADAMARALHDAEEQNDRDAEALAVAQQFVRTHKFNPARAGEVAQKRVEIRALKLRIQERMSARTRILKSIDPGATVIDTKPGQSKGLLGGLLG